jgi:hypothetical protein
LIYADRPIQGEERNADLTGRIFNVQNKPKQGQGIAQRDDIDNVETDLVQTDQNKRKK